MKNQSSLPLPSLRKEYKKAFTLMETVIAIGVLAVLLTGFIAVFTPAAQGIRRSINSQQADRLATTLEQELVTLRKDSSNSENSKDYSTGFEKAFRWIENSDKADNAIFVYQYRGDPAKLRNDGTPEPVTRVEGQPGVNYVIQPMARNADERYFQDDLKALDGAIFYVKAIQLIQKSGQLEPGTIGKIENTNGGNAESPDTYEDAVIAFSAEFYGVPSKSEKYLLGNDFKTRFGNAKRPIFTRNLAVRR